MVCLWSRYRAREAELQAVIAQSSEARDAEREMQARKFATEMQKKDEQVRLFRLELDSILDVIRTLRSGAAAGGMIIPGPEAASDSARQLDNFARKWVRDRTALHRIAPIRTCVRVALYACTRTRTRARVVCVA